MTGNTTSDSGALIIQVENHCRKLFAQFDQGEMIYHNIRHTELVVDRCEEMARYYHLTEWERFVLITAAWFHDTGQLLGDGTEHEMKSVSLVTDFFSQLNVDASLLPQISSCIQATRFPGTPQTLVEMILCDADLYHLGTELFITTNDLVKKEIEVRCHTTVSDWYHTSLQFLKHHHYFTKYCRSKLDEGKLRNIEHLERLIEG